MPNRLLFLAALIAFTAVHWIDLPTQTAAAQAEETVIAVPEPNRSDNDAPFPAGWLSIVGKSQYTIYLTGNTNTAAETAVSTAVSGQWQPTFPSDGHYRVELYVGVSEFREYALLFPEQLAGLDRLTQSANYVVTHADGETAVLVDLDLRSSGWVDLGVYSFAAGDEGFVTLSNQTDEASGTAVVPYSAARFTLVEAPTAVPPTPTALATATATETPTPAATATTAVPTATTAPSSTADPIDLLEFGSPEFAASDEGGREEAQVPLLVDGAPVGRMTISYPTKLETGQADNIKANIFVEDEFADVLIIALEDATTNQIVGDAIVQSQFFLSLEAASFAFDETFKTQKLTVFQGQPAGVAWNIAPKSGINGRQEFNIKVILRFSDGIPEVSGPPPIFAINVQSSAPPEPSVTPTPTSGGRIIDNLIDNTAVLIGGCLSFIVGLLGVIIAYLNYRKDKKAESPLPTAPAALETERQIQLHRWLDDYFDEQELRTLSMEMGVDYDDLRFSGQTNKARELVGWSARNGRLDDLTAKIQAARPNLPTDEPHNPQSA